jgi:hypothetical protein
LPACHKASPETSAAIKRFETSWQPKDRSEDMPTPTDFPNGLTVNETNLLDASAGIGALRVFQQVAGIRSEVQVIPNDGPDGTHRDPFAGGEFTVLMQDVRVTGYDNASALTIRSTRDGTTGEGVAFTMRSLSSGAAPQYPIEFDATDGTVQFKLFPDAKAWFYRQVQFVGHDDLPILRLGPSSQPAIDFEDSDGGKIWRLRVALGTVSFYNTTDGIVPFQISATGAIYALNLAALAVSGGNHTPNLWRDPADGQIYRTTWIKPKAPVISNPPTQAQVQAIVDALVAYGIMSP